MTKDFATRLRFSAPIIEWRGPAPYYYVPLPADHAARLRLAAKALTYGWGVIPVQATINKVTFTTSLFPKDGTYLLPLKVAVRRRADIAMGETVKVELLLDAVI